MNAWIIGARPRTLPAAIVPVAVGTACVVGGSSSGAQEIVWWRVAAAAIVALALQIGTNYANDYSDGVRGTDDARVGPTRLVASGLRPAAAVKRAAFLAFAVAAVAGAALALATTPWLFVVGAAAIAAGWFYTGGPRPYGYAGLGEVFVFVFFGLVATAGTAFVLSEEIGGLAVVAGCAVGFAICALLVINNLRDIPTDSASGKRTLAVRLGDPATRRMYVGLVALSFVGVVVSAVGWRPWALLGLLALPVGVAPTRTVLGGATGRALVPVLGATGRLQLVLGAAFSVGLAVGG